MTRISIDGAEYPFPEDLTLDEAIILERIGGLSLADLVPGESLPIGAIKAFVVIAMLRANPSESEKTVAAHVGKFQIEALENLLTEDGEASPPLVSESAGPPVSSGADGNATSASSPAVLIPRATGHPDSPTTATSDPETLAG